MNAKNIVINKFVAVNFKKYIFLICSTISETDKI